MSWKPLDATNMPPEGTIVLASDGNRLAMAEFVRTSENEVELIFVPEVNPIRYWMTEAEAKALLGPMP